VAAEEAMEVEERLEREEIVGMALLEWEGEAEVLGAGEGYAEEKVEVGGGVTGGKKDEEF
jgi:hypothetical protein